MKKKGTRQRDSKSFDPARRARDPREAPRKVETDALAQVTGGDDNIVWGQ